MTSKTPLTTHRARILALLVLTATMLFVAAPARAATVGFDFWSGALYYVAAPGEQNNVTISEESGIFTVSDASMPLAVQYGCSLLDAKRAKCGSRYVRWLYVKTSDGDDTVSLQSMASSYVDCGTGTDSLNTPNTTAKVSNCELVNAPPAPAPPAPAPTPEPPTAVPPPLAIAQPVTTMTRKGNVPLTLTCSETATDDCVGSLLLELPKASKSEVGASRRGAPNILGKQKLSVAKGKKRKVKVAMTGKGRSMVKRRGKLRVTAKLKIKQGGKTTTTTQLLKIKAPRHRR